MSSHLLFSPRRIFPLAGRLAQLFAGWLAGLQVIAGYGIFALDIICSLQDGPSFHRVLFGSTTALCSLASGVVLRTEYVRSKVHSTADQLLSTIAIITIKRMHCTGLALSTHESQSRIGHVATGGIKAQVASRPTCRRKETAEEGRGVVVIHCRACTEYIAVGREFV